MARKSGRRLILGWLGAFIAVPLGAWLTASLQSDFREKSLSNLALEPLVIVLISVVVFFGWFLVAREGLKPAAGIILLVFLSAAGLTLQRFVPGLRE